MRLISYSLHDSFTNLTKCLGMLIDGDNMIKIDAEREEGSKRSVCMFSSWATASLTMANSSQCTPPFLSVRQLQAWSDGKDLFDQYLDDLESFAWVLLWASLRIAQKGGTVIGRDEEWIESLTEGKPGRLRIGKVAIIYDLLQSKYCETSLPAGIRQILQKWFEMCQVAANPPGTDKRTLSSDANSTEFYWRFIDVALGMVDQLPEKWA